MAVGLDVFIQNLMNFIDSKVNYDNYGGRLGLVVRALAFQQCGSGSISALGVKCGLSLLVLQSAIIGFSWVLPFSIPLSSKTNI